MLCTVWGIHHPSCCPDIINLSFKQKTPKLKQAQSRRTDITVAKCFLLINANTFLVMKGNCISGPRAQDLNNICIALLTSAAREKLFLWLGNYSIDRICWVFPFFKERESSGAWFSSFCPLQGCPPWTQLAQSPLRSGCWKRLCFAPNHQHKNNHTRLKTVFHPWK